MSACISSRGEYGSHEYENGECAFCGHVDLDRVRADALREACDWLTDMASGYHRESGQLRAGRDIIAQIRARADRLDPS